MSHMDTQGTRTHVRRTATRATAVATGLTMAGTLTACGGSSGDAGNAGSTSGTHDPVAHTTTSGANSRSMQTFTINMNYEADEDDGKSPRLIPSGPVKILPPKDLLKQLPDTHLLVTSFVITPRKLKSLSTCAADIQINFASKKAVKESRSAYSLDSSYPQGNDVPSVLIGAERIAAINTNLAKIINKPPSDTQILKSTKKNDNENPWVSNNGHTITIAGDCSSDGYTDDSLSGVVYFATATNKKRLHSWEGWIADLHYTLMKNGSISVNSMSVNGYQRDTNDDWITSDD